MTPTRRNRPACLRFVVDSGWRMLWLIVLSLSTVLGCAHRPLDLSAPEVPNRLIQNQPKPMPETPAAAAYGHFLRAQKLEQEQRYGEAVEQLRLALAFDPQSADLHYHLGRLLLGERQTGEGVKELTEASRLNPDWYKPSVLLGEVAFFSNRLDDAVRLFERVLALKPDHEGALRRLGEIAYLTRGLVGQKAFFETMAVRYPRQVYIFEALARIYQFTQDYPQLEAALERVLELDPDNTQAIERLSDWYNRTRRYKDAIALFTRLKMLLPPNPLIPLKLGRFYLHAGNMEEARNAFAEATAFDLNNDNMAMAAALAFFEAGKLPEAETELQRIVDHSGDGAARYFLGLVRMDRKRYWAAIKTFGEIPRCEERYYLSAQVEVARCYWHLKRKSKADRRVRRLMEEHADKPDFVRTAAAFFQETERADEAVAVLDVGLEKSPNHTDLLYTRGLVLEAMGRKTEARRTMRLLLDVDKDHADALNFIGYSLVEEGIELQRAEQMIRAAMRLKPEEGYILDSLGWLYYRRGEFDEAVRWLSLATMIEPQEPEILLHLALALKQTKNTERLQVILRQAAGLALFPTELTDRYTAAFPELWPPLRRKWAPKEKP